MPKRAKTPREIFADNLMANISGEAARRHADKEDLATAAGCAISTYYKNAKDPMCFTLGQIFGLAEYLKIPVSELFTDRRDGGKKILDQLLRELRKDTQCE